MSEQLQLYAFAQLTDGSRPRPRGGSLHSPWAISVDGKTYEKEFAIAANANTDVFDITEDCCLSDFDYLMIQTTRNIFVQFVIDDQGAGGGEALGTFAVLGDSGNWSVPVWFTSDDAYEGDYTVDWGAGTAGVIERVSVQNRESSAGSVYVWAVT